MTKLIVLVLFSFQLMWGQDSIALKKNEFRVNVLALATSSRLNVSYEYFFNKKISIGLSTSYQNSKKTNTDFDNGYRNTIPKYEITPFVRYKLSKGINRFYFAELFLSANSGDFKETIRVVDENNNGYYENRKTHYYDLAMGGGLGYKMYIKQKFAIEFLVGFGRNIFNIDKSPDIIARVGLNLGYRF